MNDSREDSKAGRATLASFVSLVLVLAPWPAWGQAVRIASPAGAASAVSAAAAAGDRGSLGLTNAPPLAIAPLSPSALTANPPPLTAAALLPTAALLPHSALLSAAADVAPQSSPLSAAAPSAPSVPEFATEASVRGKTVVLVGTKSSRPFILTETVRIARELGLNLVLVDDPEHRDASRADIPDLHFIPASINTRDSAEVSAIADSVAAHPIAGKAHAVVGFMSLYASLTGAITDRLGVAGIPGKAVAAADSKPEARKLLNAADPERAVPFAEISSEEQARAAYRSVSDGGAHKVMIKTIRGENSRFLALNLDSEDSAVKAFAQMDSDVKAFVARPEAKETTFSSHPGILMEQMIEKLPGTDETSVEVVMQHGKPAFAIVSDTQGIGRNKELSGGILVFPSQQPRSAHEEMIEASGRALKAIGIENGNARLDMMMTKDGPRVIEINPLMGSVAIWKVVQSLTGMSLVEQGVRAVLGLKVDPGHAPDGVAHYIFLASGETGTVEAVDGVDEANRTPGVVAARSFVAPGDTVAAAGKATYEEWAEVIGRGKSWAESIANALTGAGRMILRIRREDAGPASFSSDLRPESNDEAIARFIADVRARYGLGDANVRYLYNSDSFRGMLSVAFSDREALDKSAVPETLRLTSGLVVAVSKGLTAAAEGRELDQFLADVRARYHLDAARTTYLYNSDSHRGMLTIAFPDRQAMILAAVPATLQLPDGLRVNVYQKLSAEGAERERRQFEEEVRARFQLGDADVKYSVVEGSDRNFLSITFRDREAMKRSTVPDKLREPDGFMVNVYRKLSPVLLQSGDYLQPTAEELGAVPAAAQVPDTQAPAPNLFSKVVLGFLSTFVLVSTVVESTSLAVSQMTEPLSQGFMALAALTSLSYAAYTFGSFLGGGIIKRFGIKNSYRAVLAVRALIWTAMALLFNPVTGTIALAALIPLFSLDYFFHSIGRVAEHSLQVAWFQNSDAASSRFGSFRDFIEYGSVFVGSAMALLVAKLGFAAVIYPAAPLFAVAALVALALKLPSAAPDRKPGRWTDGFKTVFKNPGIYKPLAGFALVNSFLYMMYYIIATAFGAYAAPDPQHAAAVAGSLTAVYGVGALAGSVVMDRLAARIDKKAQALPEAERKAGESRLYKNSAAKILPWAAAALLGSWLFVLPHQIGTLIWPIFPVSLALLAIGFTAQMASNHLDVIAKSNIPKGEKDMAVGAIRTLTYATHVVGFIAWGGLFALFGAHAFFLFAAFYSLAAGAYLLLARSLKK